MNPVTGCTITVPATKFDDDEDNRWSQAEFGEEWATKRLTGVVRSVRNGRCKVFFDYDGTHYTFGSIEMSQDPLSCPNCQPGSSSSPNVVRRQSDRLIRPAIRHESDPQPEGGRRASGAHVRFADEQQPGNNSDSDDQPIIGLAQRRENSLPSLDPYGLLELAEGLPSEDEP